MKYPKMKFIAVILAEAKISFRVIKYFANTIPKWNIRKASYAHANITGTYYSNYCYDIRTGIKIVSCQRKNQCFQTKASNIKSAFFDKDSQTTFMKKCFWLKEVSSNMK